MNNNYPKAYSEVLAIIPHIEKNSQNKISPKFINMLNKLKDNNYIPHIDFNKSLQEQKLLRETRIMLALIYRDYLCPQNERQQLLLNEKQEKDRIEKEKQKKYRIDFQERKANIHNVYQKNSNIERTINIHQENNDIEKPYNIHQESNDTEKALVEVKKEKWYQKVINRILKIFRKN